MEFYDVRKKLAVPDRSKRHLLSLIFVKIEDIYKEYKFDFNHSHIEIDIKPSGFTKDDDDVIVDIRVAQFSKENKDGKLGND